MMMRGALRFVVSLTIGVAAGVVLHYALHRMALPVEQFIYLAF